MVVVVVVGLSVDYYFLVMKIFMDIDFVKHILPSIIQEIQGRTRKKKDKMFQKQKSRLLSCSAVVQASDSLTAST